MVEAESHAASRAPSTSNPTVAATTALTTSEAVTSGRNSPSESACLSVSATQRRHHSRRSICGGRDISPLSSNPARSTTSPRSAVASRWVTSTRSCIRLAPSGSPASVTASSRASAASSTASVSAALLVKWWCSAPLLTPASVLIAVSDATANPSRSKISAADRIRVSRVRTARSCLTINYSVTARGCHAYGRAGGQGSCDEAGRGAGLAGAPGTAAHSHTRPLPTMQRAPLPESLTNRLRGFNSIAELNASLPAAVRRVQTGVCERAAPTTCPTRATPDTQARSSSRSTDRSTTCDRRVVNQDGNGSTAWLRTSGTPGPRSGPSAAASGICDRCRGWWFPTTLRPCGAVHRQVTPPIRHTIRL